VSNPKGPKGNPLSGVSAPKPGPTDGVLYTEGRIILYSLDLKVKQGNDAKSRGMGQIRGMGRDFLDPLSNEVIESSVGNETLQ
jgi:hypothetical protein